MGRHDLNFKLQYDLTENYMGRMSDQLFTKMERFEFFLCSSMQAVGISPVHRLLHYNYNHRHFIWEGEKVVPGKIIKQKIKDGILSEIEVDGVRYLGTKVRIDEIENVDVKAYEMWNVSIRSLFDNGM